MIQLFFLRLTNTRPFFPLLPWIITFYPAAVYTRQALALVIARQCPFPLTSRRRLECFASLPSCHFDISQPKNLPKRETRGGGSFGGRVFSSRKDDLSAQSPASRPSAANRRPLRCERPPDCRRLCQGVAFWVSSMFFFSSATKRLISAKLFGGILTAPPCT